MKTTFIHEGFEAICRKRFESENYKVYINSDGNLDDSEFTEHIKSAYKDMIQYVDLYVSLYSCENLKDQLCSIAWGQLEVYRDRKKAGAV